MYRRKPCPGSWAAEHGKKSKSSVAALEGTDAHTLAQWCIDNDKNPIDSINKDLDIFGGPVPKTITDDTAQAVQVYVDYVREISKGAAYAHSEIRLQMPGHIDFWGTSDMLAAHDFGTLEVIEYKHGQGKDVYPEDNEQIAAYLLGALRFARDHDITPLTLKGTIIQPRIHTYCGPRSWVIEDIEAFELKWIKIFSDTIIECLSKDPKRSAGEHCTFCLAKLDCPALKDELVLTAIDEFKDAPPESIKTEQVKDIVAAAGIEDLLKIHNHASVIKKFMSEAAEHLATLAKRGEHIPGYKLVNSVGNRAWNLSDEEMVKKFRNKKLKQEDFYNRKIKSPTQIAKILEDEKFFDKFVTRPAKGVVLVSEKDKRQAVEVVNAADEVKDD